MLKKHLGLEDSDLTDEEILEKIQEAARSGAEFVEFKIKHETVRIRLTDIDPKGIFDDDFSYWGEK